MGVLTEMLDSSAGAPPPVRDKITEAVISAGSERLSVSAPSKFMATPMDFLRHCVFTRDEADPLKSIKPWPTGACPKCTEYIHGDQDKCSRCLTPAIPLSYISDLVSQWHRADPKTLLVPKPRRFKVSWIFSAVHLWLALTRKESAIYFQSRTEDDSALLIDRCEFILENIPASKVHVPKYERRKKPPALFFENGSAIIGKPEGKNALRSVTATAIFLDEVGFWDHPRASYEAIKPLIEKGCRLTVVSSASPGFFRSLVEGTLNQ